MSENSWLAEMGKRNFQKEGPKFRGMAGEQTDVSCV